MLFFQNTTGYIVGEDYERRGIVKAGAKMINAVANAGVPKLTLMMGGSYGAGNYGMCGRSFDPRFIFSWPNHKTAVMGPKQLAGVMEIVMRAGAERRGSRSTRRRSRPARRRSRSRSRASPTRSSPAANSGTTASSTRATRGPFSGSPSRRR